MLWSPRVTQGHVQMTAVARLSTLQRRQSCLLAIVSREYYPDASGWLQVTPKSGEPDLSRSWPTPRLLLLPRVTYDPQQSPMDVGPGLGVKSVHEATAYLVGLDVSASDELGEMPVGRRS